MALDPPSPSDPREADPREAQNVDPLAGRSDDPRVDPHPEDITDRKALKARIEEQSAAEREEAAHHLLLDPVEGAS